MTQRKPGVVERLAGEAAMWAVRVAYGRAEKRGDLHEMEHLVAMLLYGNSNETNSRCLLPPTFDADGQELCAAGRRAREAKRRGRP